MEKIGAAKESRALEPLIGLLRSDTIGAAAALGKVGSRSAIGPLILRLIDGCQREDRKAILAALDSITPEWKSSPESKAVAPELWNRPPRPNDFDLMT